MSPVRASGKDCPRASDLSYPVTLFTLTFALSLLASYHQVDLIVVVRTRLR